MQGHVKRIVNDMKVITRFEDDLMSEKELRLLVKWLCEDDRLLRSFRVYYAERKAFLRKNHIAIMDMHHCCCRRGSLSSDEALSPIILSDVFSVLDNHTKIKRIVLTSRTDVFGSLGLLKTYFLQQGERLPSLKMREDRLLVGRFIRNSIEYKLFVPYSPSARVTDIESTDLEAIIDM